MGDDEGLGRARGRGASRRRAGSSTTRRSDRIKDALLRVVPFDRIAIHVEDPPRGRFWVVWRDTRRVRRPRLLRSRPGSTSCAIPRNGAQAAAG